MHAKVRTKVQTGRKRQREGTVRSTAFQVRESLGKLRVAGRVLARRPRSQRVDVLAGLLDSLRDESSTPRRRLEAELPEAAGFSPENVREGLRRGLGPWTGDELRGLVAQELGPEPGVGPWTGRRVSGFETTAVVLAGALPMPTLTSMLVPLVLGSSVLVKPSVHDPVTARVIADALGELDPELGAAIAIADFRRDDEPAMDALLAADCVVITGSDETIAAVAPRVRPPRRLVSYGHRLSVGALGPDCLEGEARDQALARFAVDVALWDQLGCLSPVALIVVGGGPDATGSVVDGLASALDAAESRWPRGPASLATAASITHARADAELRGASGADVQLRVGPGTSWTVVGEPGPQIRPTPLHRFVRVQPVPGIAELVETLAPVARHLAAVGALGFGRQREELEEALVAVGASRVCPLGEMQAPPLSWCRDAGGVLLPLARLSSVES